MEGSVCPNEHKLCGYLCAVVSVPGPTPSLPFLAPCLVFSESNQFGFRTQNDAESFLLLLSLEDNDDELNEAAKKRKKRRGRGMGTVNGSPSVVRQIHALVSHRCIKVVARVLHVDGAEESYRAVLLVDVYLPILVWSGWQFPKSRAVAGSLLSHLSCDWERRSLMLAGEVKWLKDAQRDNGIWDLPDCHVLGCKLHKDVPDSLRRKCFELHEIFRSLPGVANRDRCVSSRVNPADGSCMPGIWDVTDDILVNILSLLGPMDLVRVSATCHHLRYLAASVMPCMKLKLFPHQRAAVEWMLKRERSAEDFPHPLFQSLSTEDGFTLHVNIVSGEIITGVVPTVRDFCGGMFCDEPGLGKTITALSLILKTQGTMAEPPDGVQISFCTHNGDQRCGYYELSGDKWTRNSTILGERVTSQGGRRGRLSFDQSALVDDISFSSPKRARSEGLDMKMLGSYDSGPIRGCIPPSIPYSDPDMRLVRCTRSLSRIKKNLLQAYEEEHVLDKGKARENLSKRKRHPNHATNTSGEQQSSIGQTTPCLSLHEETWVQCDACRKWRKLNGTVPDASAAWFCSMNTDTSRQSCRDPEEASDRCQLITHLPGFCSKGTPGGNGENITFFISVLKDHHSLINWKTKKALTWLATLSCDRLSEMETIGLVSPFLGICSSSRDAEVHEFHIIFRAFGFIRRVEKGISRWHYPRNLDNLVFDLAAFRAALCEPLDSVRMYLSKATLIVVPANLVDHWKTQIQKHIKPCQLRICIWTDHKKPSAHSLAWDFDVVITTFSRLSAEWGAHKKSPLMNVHWLRVMLDEGHTLGSSLTLTNKLQMAISLMATSRWLLTGTPMPYTPDTQLSQLQPMLKFLHEEAYGWNSKSWDAGILRPFEAQMEEGRLRLLQLLDRCLISARKEDLKTIPPCIKKVKFLDFTKEHARSYNELVVTVRRNILMADWNDPSHVESLLNPKQWKFRSATVKNVRLSCCVAGHIKMAEVGADIQETMDILVEKGLDPISEEYALIKYSLQYGNNCPRCKEWCRLPVVTPCRHILCIDCVALDSERCTFPGCDFLYEMQTPEKLARPENPDPKWPVPKDLIELQPSYKQNDWDPDWLSTSSSKVAYLVQRLKELHEASGDSIYSNNCDVMVTNNIENPNSTSPTTGSTILQSGGLASISNETGIEKVIIFSQFLEHINVIEEQLTFAGIKFAGCYSPLHASKKMKALETFQHDPSCMALLMDGSTALGLDLSFATHVFLMEPIWDGSMEQQVISRAHRMGATRPIRVETLVMRGTIEEQMVKFLQDADEHGSILKREFDKSEREWIRSHHSVHDFAESNYLAQLSFVRTSPTM